MESRFKLTRKERFGIAAALVWGTMHLCDSEWLNDAISEKSIGVTFGDDDDRSSSLRTFGHPYLNISFPNSRIEHEPSVQVGRQSAQQYQKDEFISQQIQNKTLYTLAIRLMEVGLEKDFDKLRQEYEEDFPPEPSGTPISDLEIAQYHIDSLSYDGGINYRNAVESCLKFLFPGPSEKCFHYVPFRKAFFNAVVAPVQNVYDAIDEYQYQAV
ncbi:hypothetical protein N0V95_001561 [Ascochyta clinopodiicola]|nr:hypothetical protein N0V95_001561 [Ascochyta clinopodiicola]